MRERVKIRVMTTSRARENATPPRRYTHATGERYARN